MKNFQTIETRLNKAINKVKARLEVLSNLCGTEQRNHKDYDVWNDLHDLERRLTDRLWDNWSAAKDAHWDAQGFNTYP